MFTNLCSLISSCSCSKRALKQQECAEESSKQQPRILNDSARIWTKLYKTLYILYNIVQYCTGLVLYTICTICTIWGTICVKQTQKIVQFIVQKCTTCAIFWTVWCAKKHNKLYVVLYILYNIMYNIVEIYCTYFTYCTYLPCLPDLYNLQNISQYCTLYCTAMVCRWKRVASELAGIPMCCEFSFQSVVRH